MTEVPTKVCTKCGQEFPATLEFFHKEKGGRYDLRSECKSCRHAKVQAWHAANYEKVSARKRAYHAEHREEHLEKKHRYYAEHRDECIRKIKEWREANKEARSEYRKRYNAEHQEELAEKRRKYRLEHLEEMRARDLLYASKRHDERLAYGRKRYAEKKEELRRQGNEWRRNNLEKDALKSRRRRARQAGADGSHTLEDVLFQYKRQHGKCFYCGVVVGKRYHVDHVTPLVLGGSDGPENIVVACIACNLKKQGQHPTDWAGILL